MKKLSFSLLLVSLLAACASTAQKDVSGSGKAATKSSESTSAKKSESTTATSTASRSAASTSSSAQVAYWRNVACITHLMYQSCRLMTSQS